MAFGVCTRVRFFLLFSADLIGGRCRVTSRRSTSFLHSVQSGQKKTAIQKEHCLPPCWRWHRRQACIFATLPSACLTAKLPCHVQNAGHRQDAHTTTLDRCNEVWHANRLGQFKAGVMVGTHQTAAGHG